MAINVRMEQKFFMMKIGGGDSVKLVGVTG